MVNEEFWIIAGNGPSLSCTPRETFLTTDKIVRVNNFFLESKAYFGCRVDLAFVGGDPRVAPFLLHSLRKAGQFYEIKHWTSDDCRIAKRRSFAGFKSLPDVPTNVASRVSALLQNSGKYLLSGTRALLSAYAFGARKQILTGFDFYDQASRYAFMTGARQKQLLGSDLDERGLDNALHDPAIDLQVIETIADAPDVEMFYVNGSQKLASFLDPLPKRTGTFLTPMPKPLMTDWALSPSQYIPFSALRLSRRLRGFVAPPKGETS